jgi:nitrile hydratase
MTNAERVGVVLATNEQAQFAPGDRVRIGNRSPIGHYRVPRYLRDQLALVDSVVEPSGIDNEEEGFGRNAGQKRHYYRLLIPMRQLWPNYVGSAADVLFIEVFENWLERI